MSCSREATKWERVLRRIWPRSFSWCPEGNLHVFWQRACWCGTDNPPARVWYRVRGGTWLSVQGVLTMAHDKRGRRLRPRDSYDMTGRL